MSDIPDEYRFRLDMKEQLERIDRMRAEAQKFAAEQQKLSAEQQKFAAESAKFAAVVTA